MNNGFDLVVWNGVICYYYAVKVFLDSGEEFRIANSKEVDAYLKINF